MEYRIGEFHREVLPWTGHEWLGARTFRILNGSQDKVRPGRHAMSCKSSNSPDGVKIVLGSSNVRSPVRVSEIEVRNSTWSIVKRMNDTSAGLQQLFLIQPFLQF